ncbi:MAG: glycosyltransferase family 4 protein [Actinobacteria bacterium]|nr:glycosyltransferase family 4 protein [Actinomycetota bacterium]
MRVLQVSDTFPPAMGGLERYVATLSRRLAAEAVEVVVATLDYPGAEPAEMTDGYRVVRLPGLTRRLRRFASDPGHFFHPTVPDPTLVWRLQRLVDRFQPDVIHAHGWILESCVALRRPRGTALVATLHEYGAVCVKKTYTQTATGCPTGPQLVRCIACARSTYGLPKSALLSTGLRLVRPLHRRVDRWIAISAAVAEANRVALLADVDRIDVVPTFVQDEVGQLARTPLTLDVPDQPFLLFVGAMGPHKGLDVLLDARERMRVPAPLVVLGMPRADAPDLDRPGVVVHEDVPHPQVMASWAAATVGVVPSVWPEPFGQVAVECLAAGTPAVVSATGGLGEIVRDGVEGLLVPPADADALARALDRVLHEPDLRERLAAAAPARAAQYELSRVLPMLLHTYERALKHRRAAGCHK